MEGLSANAPVVDGPHRLIKVDRARSVEEAVALDPHPAFADARVLSPGTAGALTAVRALGRAV